MLFLCYLYYHNRSVLKISSLKYFWKPEYRYCLLRYMLAYMNLRTMLVIYVSSSICAYYSIIRINIWLLWNVMNRWIDMLLINEGHLWSDPDNFSWVNDWRVKQLKTTTYSLSSLYIGNTSGWHTNANAKMGIA